MQSLAERRPSPLNHTGLRKLKLFIKGNKLQCMWKWCTVSRDRQRCHSGTVKWETGQIFPRCFPHMFDISTSIYKSCKKCKHKISRLCRWFSFQKALGKSARVSLASVHRRVRSHNKSLSLCILCSRVGFCRPNIVQKTCSIKSCSSN